MKLSFRSLSLLLATILAGNLFFSSCKDENNDPAKPSTPLLATMSSYGKDGTLHELESYRYDTNGRLVEMNNDDDYKVVLEYSPSTVTLKEYDESELAYSTLFNLNANGLAISSISDDGTITFTYDENGYNKTSVEENGSSTITETYTVSNLNIVTITSEVKHITSQSAQVKKSVSVGKSLIKSLGKSMETQNILKSASDQISTYRTDFEFYTDKKNTIDFENLGIYFFGKQNNNPVKRETETSLERPVRTFNYTYEYDTKGRIIKKIWEHGGYDVYTYVD